jgi:tetratricopeptide (TPR) repeat protein
LLQVDAGRYTQAEEDFSRAIELEPTNPDGYLRLARVYQKTDRIQDAIQIAFKAIQVAPHYFRSYQQLGGFYYHLGEYEKAANKLATAVNMNPGEPSVHVALASAQQKLGQYAQAERELRIALRLHETSDTHVNLGAVLASEHRYREAILEYKRAVALSPKAYLSWMNLGDNCRWVHKTNEAKQAYERALGLTREQVSRNPQDGYIRALMGEVLARLGQKEQADYEISQALRILPVSTDVFMSAVFAYEALGQRARALEVLEQAPRSVVDDLVREPDLADLRHDPRFIALLDRKLR